MLVKDLIKANVLNESDEIIYLNTVDIKYAYVIFDNERKASIKIIHDYLKKFDIIPFGRYGMWAYLWSDEAMLSGKKLQRSFLKIITLRVCLIYFTYVFSSSNINNNETHSKGSASNWM